jgi:type II secretory pathway pseudopilin PulG
MNERTAPLVRKRNRQAGFSLIETLVAAALLLFIIIGVLPLFARSQMNLVQGNDASNVANATVDVGEQLLSLPFKSQATNLPPGAGTQFVTTDFWLAGRVGGANGHSELGDRWVTDMTPYPNDKALYTRTVTIEQFQVSDLTSDGVLDTPLDGDASDGQVQLKRITMDIVNARTALAGAATTYHVITFQTF